MNLKLTIPLILSAFFAQACTSFSDSSPSANSASAPSVSESNSALPSSTPSIPTTERKNFLAYGSGAFVIGKTSQYDRTWQAVNILDESPKYGWSSDGGDIGTQSISIELAAPTILKSIVFDTAQVDGEDVAAKDVTVEVSETSATEGFREILSTSLKNKEDNQEFTTKEAIRGQWVRVNFKSNYGSPKYNSVMEVRGYGEQLPPAPLENVSGTYKSDFGDFHIKQEGTSISGCYEYDGGLLDGGIEDRVMKLQWSEAGGSDSRGPAMMSFSKDGKMFAGVWSDGSFEKGFGGEWSGTKISDKVGSCSHRNDLDGEKTAQNRIEKNLAEDGRAVLYGINFNFNSDSIRAESKPTLDQIAEVLKANNDWKMTIEGHTDFVGGESFNKTLSERRAEAVKVYLTSAGIESSRLSSAGLGLSKPIATNDTEAGRAQNRRVELVKQ
jgi:Outer membrane protein and related peptidoglycan-associated (lipo)proteins